MKRTVSNIIVKKGDTLSERTLDWILAAMRHEATGNEERLSWIETGRENMEVPWQYIIGQVEDFQDYNPFGKRKKFKHEWVSSEWSTLEDVYNTLVEVQREREEQKSSDCQVEVQREVGQLKLEKENVEKNPESGMHPGAFSAWRTHEQCQDERELTYVSEGIQKIVDREKSVVEEVVRHGSYRVPLQKNERVLSLKIVSRKGLEWQEWSTMTCHRTQLWRQEKEDLILPTIGCAGPFCGQSMSKKPHELVYLLKTTSRQEAIPSFLRIKRDKAKDTKTRYRVQLMRGIIWKEEGKWFSKEVDNIRELNTMSKDIERKGQNVVMQEGYMTHIERLWSIVRPPPIMEQQNIVPAIRWKEVEAFLKEPKDLLWDLGGGDGRIGTFFAKKLGASYLNIEKESGLPQTTMKSVLILAYESLHHMASLERYHQLVQRAEGQCDILVREHDVREEELLEVMPLYVWYHRMYRDFSPLYLRNIEEYKMQSYEVKNVLELERRLSTKVLYMKRRMREDQHLDRKSVFINSKTGE